MPVGAGWIRKLAACTGLGFMVAVGYMDLRNWATDLAGGSAFGYTPLSVVLLSNIMAVLLQAPAARLDAAILILAASAFYTSGRTDIA